MTWWRVIARKAVLAAAACAAGVLAACSTSAPDARGASPLSSPPPAQSTDPAQPTDPVQPTDLVQPTTEAAAFDCTAVEAARERLQAEIDAALARLGVGSNSPQAYTVTLVVTASRSPQYWRSALTSVPADLAEPARLVMAHWTALEPALAQIDLSSASPQALQSAHTQVSRLTAAGEDVAALERTVSRRLDRDCPAS